MSTEYTRVVVIRVSRYETYYKSQVFPREIDFAKPLGVEYFVLPHTECVECPHLLPWGNPLFPYIEHALRKRGAFAKPGGYSYGVVEPDRLYAVVPTLQRPHRRELPPRFDLAPMNHAAACNFMQACTTEYNTYHLIGWPDEIPHPNPPMYSTGYRKGAEPAVKETPA